MSTSEDIPVENAPTESVVQDTTTNDDAATSAAAPSAPSDRPKTPPAQSGDANGSEVPQPSPRAQKLAAVTAAATKQYALKNWSQSAELYAEAAEIQASINGEQNPLNADLLFFYGRALFQCGVSKSDVLGGGVEDASGAGAGGSGKGKQKEKAAKKKGDDGGVGSSKSAAATAAAESSLDPKPKANFHFSGDENFTESEDEADEEGEEGEGEAEQDDFTLAWEILDLARVLFVKRLEDPPKDEKELRQIKERLSDVYDHLGEVSLESESFKQAVDDLSASLQLKEEIYPPESTLISEAHYKLSLALEFASQGGGEGEAEAEVSEEDQKKGRAKSAEHMRAAIDSCKKRISLESKALSDSQGETVNGKPRDRAEKSLSEAKELVKELEQRLQDLTLPPQASDIGDEEALQGILGSLIGKNPMEAKKQLEQAISGAKDLGGIVRKKDKQAADGTAAAATSSSPSATKESAGAGSKRKAEDDEPAIENPDTEMTSAAEPSSKKARVTTEEEEQASTS